MSGNWAEERASHWFVTGWASRLETILCSMAVEDQAISATLTPDAPHPEVWEAWKDPIWCSAKAEIKDGAELFIGCARDTARVLISGAIGEEAGPDLNLDAYRKLIAQTLSDLSSTIEGEIGKPVRFEDAVEASQPSEGGLGVEYQVSLRGVVHLVVLVPSPELIDALLVTPDAAESDSSAQRFVTAAADSPMELTADESGTATRQDAPVSHNLGMILDVDLDLSVSFGKTELLLDDVLKLASGSIVELNRSANDPVDVLVNNTVVARGEVVVVDGNYGIRITEVVSEKERIRSVM